MLQRWNGFLLAIVLGAGAGPVLAQVASTPMAQRLSAGGGRPSEAARTQFAQRMVPLLDTEEALLREKLALIEAKKAQLLAPYDEVQALALRERERDLMQRFQRLAEQRREALGSPQDADRRAMRPPRPMGPMGGPFDTEVPDSGLFPP